MGKFNRTDLYLTDDGDLLLAGGDLHTVENEECTKQSARNRIKTSDPEWYDYKIDHIGANLEDLRGLPNTPDTAKKGVRMIGEVLTRDGLVTHEELYINPIPMSRDVIVFFVFINFPNLAEPIGFEVSFNLSSGLTVRSA